MALPNSGECCSPTSGDGEQVEQQGVARRVPPGVAGKTRENFSGTELSLDIWVKPL